MDYFTPRFFIDAISIVLIDILLGGTLMTDALPPHAPAETNPGSRSPAP
jgi:hypothetical protein